MSEVIGAAWPDVHGYDVGMTIELVDHLPVCRELVVRQRRPDGKPVTLAGIRDIPLARLMREALGQAPRHTVASKGPTDTALRLVAAIYREALAHGDPAPANAVWQAIGGSRSTTGRWIVLARRRGFLGPARGPGKVAP